MIKAKQIKRLHDRAAELLAEMNELDPRPADHLFWEAAHSLESSLIPLWGAFGALAMREQTDS